MNIGCEELWLCSLCELFVHNEYTQKRYQNTGLEMRHMYMICS